MKRDADLLDLINQNRPVIALGRLKGNVPKKMARESCGELLKSDDRKRHCRFHEKGCEETGLVQRSKPTKNGPKRNGPDTFHFCSFATIPSIRGVNRVVFRAKDDVVSP